MQFSGPGTGGQDAWDYGRGEAGLIGGLTLAGYIFDVAVGAFGDGLADTGAL